MEFASQTQELSHWKKLATSSVRADTTHPDDCPKLKIHGVMWAIPPRGQRVAPKIDDTGKLTGITAETADSWEEIDALRDALVLPDDVICPTCGQATETSVKVTDAVLTAAFALAIRALKAQYKLTPSQLVGLLAFSEATPDWFKPLVRWSSGLSTEEPEDEQIPQGWGVNMNDAQEFSDFQPRKIEPRSRFGWLKFWKRSG